MSALVKLRAKYLTNKQQNCMKIWWVRLLVLP